MARRVGRRVQRHGEVRDPGLVGQPLQPRREADRRQGDPPGREREPARRGEYPQRLHRRRVVVQRLAHAHQHDVEAPVLQAELAGQHPDLPRDFTGREVPGQPHLPGQAEPAAHRAPDLSRDAEGHRRGVGDEHRLDAAPVAEGEHELLGAVVRVLPGGDAGGRERQGAGERRPERTGEVGHAVEPLQPPAVDPAIDLAAVVRFGPVPGQRLLELVRIELREVGERVGHASTVPWRRPGAGPPPAVAARGASVIDSLRPSRRVII